MGSGKNYLNRLSFGIALFVVLTMVIPAPSTVFSSLIQPLTQESKSAEPKSQLPFSQSLFSLQDVSAQSPPTISISSPSNGSAIQSTSFVISGQVTGTLPLFASVSRDGGPFSSNFLVHPPFWSIGMSGLSLGTHKILARVTDSLGNVGISYSTNAVIGSSIPVGGTSPFSAVFDSKNGLIYVTNSGSSTVSVINGTSNSLATGFTNPISVGSNPYGIAYDSIHGSIYVSTNGGVSVINDTSNTVTTTITGVPTILQNLAFDSANGYLYALYPNKAFVIDTATNTQATGFINPINLGNTTGFGIAFDSLNNNLYVTNLSGNSVSVINGTSNSVIGSPITVGTSPQGITFDSANGDLYVDNPGSNSVSVINGATNTVTKTITVGTGPFSSAFDSANGNIYVVNPGSSSISVINGTSNSITGSQIPLTSGSSSANSIVFDSANGNLYEVTSGNSLARISTPTIITVIPDTTPPTVSITSPVNGTTIASSDITITGTSSDSGSGMNSVQVSIDGGQYYLANGTTSWSFTKHGLANGLHSIVARAADNFGNAAFSPGRNSVVSTITGLNGPIISAVNPYTDTIYVSQNGNNTISVINGTTGAVITNIPVGNNPSHVAVNPYTNMVYVPNENDNTVSVINGTTNTVKDTISVPGTTTPIGIAVNPNTNLVYVTGFGSSAVTIINGTSDTVYTTIAINGRSSGVSVNPVTNMIYVTNNDAGTITVINGTTNVIKTTVPVGNTPDNVVVNHVTDTIYVSNQNDNTVSVINGTSDTIIGSPIAVGNSPLALDVNTMTNTIYVPNYDDNTISVINGTTNTVIDTVAVAASPQGVTVNENTGKEYVPSTTSNTLSILSTPTFFTVNVAPSFPSTSSASSSTGAGTVNFATSNGGFDNVTPLTESSLTTVEKPSEVSLPYGAFSFNVTGLTPGSTDTINMTFPAQLPPNAEYWKIGSDYWINETSHISIVNNGYSMLLTLKDGDANLDLDLTTNGNIVDPGAVVVPPNPALTPTVSEIGSLSQNLIKGIAIVPTPTETMYEVNTYGSNVDEVSLSDGTISSPPVSMTLSGLGYALATDPTSNELYAITDGSPGRELVMLNPATGAVTDIGNTGLQFAGLAFGSDGTLYGITGNSGSSTHTIFMIDKSTAQPTLFVAVSAGSGHSIAYNPDDGFLYHGYGQSPAYLEKIDLATKAITPVDISSTPLASAGQIYAMTYWESSHLMLINVGNTLYSINLGTTTPPPSSPTYELQANNANGDCETLGGTWNAPTCTNPNVGINGSQSLIVDSGVTVDLLTTEVSNHGNITNNGIINMNGTDINNEGGIDNQAGGIINNTSSGTINVIGVDINVGGRLDNEGTIYNSGMINNNWHFFNNPSGLVTNNLGGVINNSVPPSLFGFFDNQAGATVTNNGTINDYCGTGGSFANDGTLTGNVPQNLCTAPKVTIISPANGTTVNTSTPTISGTAADSGSGVQKVEVSVNGGPFGLASGTTSWSFTTAPLTNGVHKVVARATDNAGNYGFSYDTNAVFGSSIPVGTGPDYIAYDSANHNLYVANDGDNTVSVINGTTNNIIGSPIPVGSAPEGIAFDAANGNLYVANSQDDTVSMINGTTNLVSLIPISVGSGTGPFDIAYDSANGNLYVTDSINNTVSVINGTTNTVTGSIPVGNSPIGITYDSANHNLYVANNGDNTVSTINGTTNTVIGSAISVGQQPYGITYDSANNIIYVTDSANSTVSTINGTTNTVTGSIPVGSVPYGIAMNANGNLYVTNKLDNTVSVINGTTNTVTDTVNLGSSLEGVTADPENGIVYVSNYGSNSVSMISTPTIFTVNVASFPSSTSVASSTNAGNVTFSTPSGGFNTLAALSQSDTGTTGLPPNVALPYGAFAFNIVGVTPIGSTDVINMTFPAQLAPNTQYWKDQSGTWVNATSHVTIVNNGYSMLLNVTDGGFGDSDASANGIISDPGAIVIPSLVRIAVASGQWNNTATWGGVVPSSFDSVIIPNGIFVTIPTGLQVNIDYPTGKVTVNSGGILSNAGYIVNGLNFTNFGLVFDTGRIQHVGSNFTNFGTMLVPGRVDGNENFTNAGSINVTSSGFFSANGAFINRNNAAFNNTGDSTFASPLVFENNGTILNGGGTITIHNTGLVGGYINFGTINNKATIFNLGPFTNAGTINNYCGATFNNTGSLLGNSINNISCSGTSDFTVQVPTTLNAPRSGSASGNVMLSSLNGFNGTVNLAVTGLPPGVGASLNNTLGLASGGTNSTLLTLNIGPSVQPGNYTVTVNGTSGLVSHTGIIDLVVLPPDFAISALNPVSAVQGSTGNTTILVGSLDGFAGSVMVSLNATTVPSGVSLSASQDPVNISSGGSNSTVLSLGIGPSVAPGTYTIQAIGTSGALSHSKTFALTVYPSIPSGDFIINATGVVAVQGNSGPSTVNATSLSGFNSPVTLSVSNLPSGVTGAFAQNPVTPATNGFVTSTLNLGIDSSTVPGNYNVNVTGTSGILSHSFGMNLTITPAVVAGVSPTITQPVVLSSNVYQPGAAGGLQIYNPSAGTSTVQVLIRSSSDPAGMLVTLPLTSTGMYTTTNQITYSSASTDQSSVLHALSGDAIYVQYPPGSLSFLLSNSQATAGGIVTGAQNQNVTFGTAGDIPITGDWYGTGNTTIGVYRPSVGKFFLSTSQGNLSATTSARIILGGAGDIPITGDWDGSGKTEVGIYIPSNSTFLLSNTQAVSGSQVTASVNQRIVFGSSGDIPIAGDWTGQGHSTIGVYRPSVGKFFLSNTQGSASQTVTAATDQRIIFGTSGDIPITGDWDGNGTTDVGVYRPSVGKFFLSNTHASEGGQVTGSTYERIVFGTNGDDPVSGNWNGQNHQSKVGVMRLINSVTATTAAVATNQVPVAGATVSYITNLDCINDSSQDGICDEWKYSEPANGLPAGVNISINGVNYNFACNPNAVYSGATGSQVNDPLGDQVCPVIGTKDIYVEIDYMVGQQPDTNALSQVVNAFLAHNIHLHLLVDENMGLHYDNIPLTTTLNSDGSVNQLGFFGASGSQGYKQGLKDMFFGTSTERANVDANDLLTAKRQFYHYAMYIHNLTTPGGVTGQSGYGEIRGNDILVSLGSFTNGVGSTAEQAATFMHELGHNLGLDHGGPLTLQSTGQLVTDHSLNCKPNYPSVMNYLYQMPYLVSNRPLDFSEPSTTSTGTIASTTITNTLNESNLNESSGINETGLAQGWQAVIGGVDANGGYQQSVVPFAGSVDFDQENSAITTTAFTKDIHQFNIPNCDANTNNVVTTLTSYDDWDNLNLEFRQSQVFQNGFFTIDAADPSGSDVRNINSLAVSSLADSIASLPDSAFAPNYAPDMKTIFNGELVRVSNAIQAGDLVGIGSASDQLQNIVLPQMSGSGTASTNVLITDPTVQQQVSVTVNNIISALVSEGTPSPTNNLSPGAQNEVLTVNENTPLAITLNAADPRGLSLLVNITSPSHGTLTPTPIGTNLDFSSFNSMNYVPASNFVGQDQFTYQVKSIDSLGVMHVSNLATVTINIMGTTSMTLSLPQSTVVGTHVTVSAQVTGFLPTGTVSFSGDGTFAPSDTCTLDSDTCSVTFIPLDVGQVSVSATYTGDALNEIISSTGSMAVSQTTTSTQVQLSPSTVTIGGTTTVTAQVTGFSPSGMVSFAAPSGTFSSNSCTLNGDACSVTYTASSTGLITVSASYGGDENNKPSSGNTVLIAAPLQGQKSGIASNIKSLESGITDKNTVQKLDRAAMHVQKSADNKLWNTDGNTLNLKKGKQVFNEEADSVNLLLRIIQKPTSDDTDLADTEDADTHDQDLNSLQKTPAPSSLISSLNTIINQLETIDSTLAQSQINAANSLLTSLQARNVKASLIQSMHSDINTANNNMQKAQSDLAAGNYHRAMFEYRQAWSFATQAINLGS